MGAATLLTDINGELRTVWLEPSRPSAMAWWMRVIVDGTLKEYYM
jgi:hypothetical protein